MAITVPLPRTPLDGDLDGGSRMWWYEHELGWATADDGAGAGAGVQLLTGLRFDVLDLPATAGFAVLRRVGGDWPVALAGRRMRMLVAAGSADELPGLLDWLEWGGVALHMTALGTGGRMPAPIPPGWSGSGSPGAAVWLRPPEPGREVEPTLPALSALPAVGGGDAPDLARLVAAAATECHRIRLLSAGAGSASQRLASS